MASQLDFIKFIWLIIDQTKFFFFKTTLKKKQRSKLKLKVKKNCWFVNYPKLMVQEIYNYV